MKEELLKSYINKLKKEDIENYLYSECVEASSNEIDVLYDLIKNHYEDIINNDFMTYISNYEQVFNRELYLKIIEKYNKYKSLLE